MLTRASISRRLGGSRLGYALHIDETATDTAPQQGRAALLLIAFGFVLLFVFLQGVAVLLLGAVGQDVDLSGALDTTSALQLAATQTLGILAVVALVALGVSSRARLGLAAPRGSFDRGWRALLPVGLLVIGPTVGYVIATGGHVLDRDVDAVLAAALILLAVLIAINEELWFRGLVVDRLGGPSRPWFVVIFSSLLFGLPHLGATEASWLNAAGVTLAVGIPFAVVRLRCGSLLPLIAWHALIDIWAFLHTASVVPEGDPSTADALAGMLLPALIAVGYVIWMARGEQAERSA